MDIGSVFLLIALIILIALFISRPLFERKVIPLSPEEHKRSTWMAERDRILNALQELDFDYTLGKIPEADYPAQRAALLKRGADALRWLDKFEAEKASEDTEARIEAAIATRSAEVDRRSRPTGSRLVPSPVRTAEAVKADVSDDEVETLLASRRRAREGKSAGFCPQCGRAVQKSDRFCPNCGKPLG